MKIVLFQFYSPFAMPDYDEMGTYLSRKGHDVFVTHMTLDKNLLIRNNGRDHIKKAYPSEIMGKKHFKFIRRRIVNFLFMIEIRRWIKELMPNVFIINPAELMYFSLLPLFMPHNIKFILDIRQLGLFPGEGVLIKIKNIRAKLRFVFLQKYVFDHTCFASEEAASFIIGDQWRHKNISIKKVGVNQLFFDVLIPQKNKNEILQLVYIGSLARIRKLEFIIDAIKILAKETDQFHVTFIGPSIDNYYLDYISNHGLTSLISILEPIQYDKVPEMLQKYDVAIAYVPDHPDWEYQPTLKILEYRAAGIPIVATDNIPDREIVKENITGCFFQNNFSSFNSILLKLINDKRFLDTIKLEAATNRLGLTWKDSADNYEKLILTL